MEWVMRGLASVCIGVAVLAVGSAALANGSCGYERCFGAIAVGQSGAIGKAAGERTHPGALEVAQNLCGSSCEVEVFWNACGAVAMAGDGTWTFGWDETLDLAQSRAVEFCQEDGVRSCYVRDWICSQ